VKAEGRKWEKIELLYPMSKIGSLYPVDGKSFYLEEAAQGKKKPKLM